MAFYWLNCHNCGGKDVYDPSKMVDHIKKERSAIFSQPFRHARVMRVSQPFCWAMSHCHVPDFTSPKPSLSTSQICWRPGIRHLERVIKRRFAVAGRTGIGNIVLKTREVYNFKTDQWHSVCSLNASHPIGYILWVDEMLYVDRNVSDFYDGN